MPETDNPLDLYQSIKRDLDIVHDDLVDIFEQLGTRLHTDGIRTQQARLRSQTLQVVVAGAMKQGKSTLLNAMLGETVLPSKPTKPWTAVPIRVLYDKARRAECYPKDGAEPEKLSLEVDPLAVLRRVATLDGDSDDTDRQSISYERVDVYWPAKLCEKDVVLIDTPGFDEYGVGGRQRKQETWKNLEQQADAVLLVLDCDSISNQTNFEALNRLLSSVVDRASLFVVANQADLIAQRCGGDIEAVDETKEYIRNALASLGVPLDRIFFTSALEALNARRDHEPDALEQSGVPDLEKALHEYLLQHRARAKLQGPLIATERYLQEATTEVLVKQDSFPFEKLKDSEKASESARAASHHASEATSRTTHKVQHTIDRAAKEAARTIPQLIETLCVGISGALEKADITNREAVFDKEYAAGVVERRARRWSDDQVRSWQNETLDAIIREYASGLDLDLQETNRSLRFLRNETAKALYRLLKIESGNQDTDSGHEHQNASVADDYIGSAYGYASSDGPASGVLVGAIAGGVAGTWLGLYFASQIMFPPIAALSAIGGLIGFASAASRLKRRMAEHVQLSLRDNQKQLESQVYDWVHERMTSACAGPTASMEEVTNEIQELAAQIEEVTQRYRSESEELKARCDAMRQRLQSHLSTVSSMKAALDKQLSPEQLADLIAGRLSAGSAMAEPKQTGTTERTLGYYLDVLEEGAGKLLDRVVNALERLGQRRGDSELRIAELWSHFPSKAATAEQDAYRVVCAMAVGEGTQGTPRDAAVWQWLRDQQSRDRLRCIAEVINPNQPLIFEEDISSETSDDAIPTKQDSYHARWRRGRDKAFPPVKTSPRKGTVVRSKDVPLPENRES